VMTLKKLNTEKEISDWEKELEKMNPVKRKIVSELYEIFKEKSQMWRFSYVAFTGMSVIVGGGAAIYAFFAKLSSGITVLAGNVTGQVLYNEGGRLSGVLADLFEFLKSWEAGAILMVFSSLVVVVGLALIALIKDAPKNEESISEALMRMMVDDEFTYLKGFKTFLRDKEFLKENLENFPEQTKEIVLNMWERNAAEGEKIYVNIKDAQDMLEVFELYKKWLDKKLIEANNLFKDSAWRDKFKEKVEGRDPYSWEALTDVLGMDGNPAFNEDEIYENASNEDIIKDIKKYTQETEQIIKGEESYSWRTFAFGALSMGVGVAMFFNGNIHITFACIFAVMGLVPLIIYFYEKLYKLIHGGKSPYVMGRYYYHLMQYAPQSISLIEYYGHMYTVAKRNFVRNFLVLFLWNIPEGFWTRGRTDASRKKLGQPQVEMPYISGRITYYLTARAPMILFILFVFFTIVFHPVLRRMGEWRQAEQRVENKLDTKVKTYALGLHDDIGSIVEAYKREELDRIRFLNEKNDTFKAMGYVNAFIERYLKAQYKNEEEKDRYLKAIFALIKENKRYFQNKVRESGKDIDVYKSIYARFY
ncbi:MAG: hypothetical protein KAI70_08295, partial [Candidatus Omnitrophica bacterium]|nr:hypothetical protein [Candidatus Omnitrophota bacterium]